MNTPLACLFCKTPLPALTNTLYPVLSSHIADGDTWCGPCALEHFRQRLESYEGQLAGTIGTSAQGPHPDWLRDKITETRQIIADLEKLS